MLRISPVHLAIARALQTDQATAEAVRALRSRGVEAVILRGPAIARQLYDAAGERPYVDADLLVEPANRAAVEAELSRLGYVENLGVQDFLQARHAVDWSRARDGATLDLHWTISGPQASPAEVWHAFREHTEPLVIGGEDCTVPDRTALAVVVTLHMAQHADRKPKPRADLERAIARFDEATWHAAASLAGRVAATAPFDAGLRSIPAGVALAERLGLQPVNWAEADLRRAAAPRGALSLYQIARERSWGRRAWMVYRSAVPTRAMLRRDHPEARAGRRAELAAYGRRGLAVAHGLPGALRAAWRAAR